MQLTIVWLAIASLEFISPVATQAGLSRPQLTLNIQGGHAHSSIFESIEHVVDTTVLINKKLSLSLREAGPKCPENKLQRTMGLAPLKLTAGGADHPGAALEDHKHTQNSGPKSLNDWQNDLETFGDQTWIDLDQAPSYELSRQHPELISALNDYHNLPKVPTPDTAEVSIHSRITALKKIDLLCQKQLSHITDELEKTKLELISQTALNKADYLTEILKIPEREERIKPRSSPTGNTQAGLLYLKGDYTSSTKLPTLDDSSFKRRELLEHLDPANRDREVLEPRYHQWLELKEKNKNPPNFFQWLEGENLRKDGHSRNQLDEDSGTLTRQVLWGPDHQFQSTTHLTRTERTYSKNMLNRTRNADSDPIHNDAMFREVEPGETTSEIHYAISESGALFIRSKSPYHSYILRGEPVLSAGMIKFKNGKIESLDNESGHYAPSRSQLNHALDVLKGHYKVAPGQSIFSDTFSLKYSPNSTTV